MIVVAVMAAFIVVAMCSDEFLRNTECAVCHEDQFWHWTHRCDFCGNRVCNGEGDSNDDCSGRLRDCWSVFCDDCWEEAHGLE